MTPTWLSTYYPLRVQDPTQLEDSTFPKYSPGSLCFFQMHLFLIHSCIQQTRIKHHPCPRHKAVKMMITVLSLRCTL